MADIERRLRTDINIAFNELFKVNLDLDEFAIQPTRAEFIGTHTFVVFSFLKISKKKPEETANEIGEHLMAHSELIDNYNVVKGFLNLSLKHQVWVSELKTILNEPDFGVFPNNGKKVMLEFSSPNTNKPLHLGHLRNIF